MAKQIPLTQGKFAIVDDDVYEWASKFNWFAHQGRYGWYAARHSPRPNRKTIFLHREIMKAPHGTRIDHINGDGLNDLRENLRFATNAENLRNRGPQANNTSGYKGVSWNKVASKWVAHIQVDGKQINLGLSGDPVEAAKVYDTAARKYHGPFAWTNFDAPD